MICQEDDYSAGNFGQQRYGEHKQGAGGFLSGAELRKKRFPADASAEELKAWAEGFGIQYEAVMQSSIGGDIKIVVRSKYWFVGVGE